MLSGEGEFWLTGSEVKGLLVYEVISLRGY
jgi:hypothetical protein